MEVGGVLAAMGAALNGDGEGIGGMEDEGDEVSRAALRSAARSQTAL